MPGLTASSWRGTVRWYRPQRPVPRVPELGYALTHPVVTIARRGDAHMMFTSDGGVFNFGAGLFFGCASGTRRAAPIMGAAATS